MRDDTCEFCQRGDMPDPKQAVDPWTFGELNPAGSPRDPAASLMPNRPGQPFRRSSRERAAGTLPTSALARAPAGCRPRVG